MTGHDARVVANGGAAHVYVADGPAPRSLRVARLRDSCWASCPAWPRVLKPPDACRALGLPTPDEDPTQGDLMLAAADGWHFADHVTLEAADKGAAPSREPRPPARRPAATRGAGRGGAGDRERGAGPGRRATSTSRPPSIARLLGVAALPAAERPPLQALLSP